jgi:hypothetical protein
MALREMDPELVWKLLEGHEDGLKPESDKEQAFFRHVMCPSCHSYTHEQFVNPKRPFSPGAVLVNKLLRCTECKTEFDPHSGLITKATIPERG